MKNLAGTLRDKLYDFVAKEGDFALQFVANTIHGPRPQKDDAFLKRQLKKTSQEEQLNFEERQTFNEILKRREGENQIDYWKRKKHLLAASGKKQMIEHYMSLKQRKAKLSSFKKTSSVKSEQKQIERQFHEIKSVSSQGQKQK